jgi:hypothetical protein
MKYQIFKKGETGVLPICDIGHQFKSFEVEEDCVVFEVGTKGEFSFVLTKTKMLKILEEFENGTKTNKTNKG